MNNDQRHFPMLREYEKAKMAMQQQQQNLDLDAAGASAERSFHDPERRNSPYGNFLRTTAGKKLYFETEKTGPVPPTRVHDATTLMKTRQRFLYRQRDQNGLPLAAQFKSRLHDHEVVPAVGRKHCKEKNMAGEQTTEVGLHEDEYDRKRVADFADHERSKQRRLAGEFTNAYHHDNGEAVDEFGMKLTIRQRAARGGKTEGQYAGADPE